MTDHDGIQHPEYEQHHFNGDGLLDVPYAPHGDPEFAPLGRPKMFRGKGRWAPMPGPIGRKDGSKVPPGKRRKRNRHGR